MTKCVICSLLYWSWWTVKPAVGKVERAWMDGTHREVVVETITQWPSSIALKDSTLYWADFYSDKIMRFDLNTKETEVS